MFHTTVLIQQHNTNIHAPGGIFFYFVSPGFFPFDPFLCCIKSFRPSCHFTFHTTVFTTNTTQTSMPPVGFFLFLSVRGFSPLIHFCTVLNPFVLHVTFTFHATVLITNNTNIHAPGGIRTHDPSKRAAEDPRLRPRGHWVHHDSNPGPPIP
jgi:hypothetical protein